MVAQAVAAALEPVQRLLMLVLLALLIPAAPRLPEQGGADRDRGHRAQRPRLDAAEKPAHVAHPLRFASA